MNIGFRVSVVALVAIVAPAAMAFQNPPQEPMTGPLSQVINVPQLVENYARFLARKYSLDEGQERATVEILQKRTQDFLANHEEKIFELYNSMLIVRGGGDMSQQELVDWGKSAMPIYQDAKEIIIGGNAEWRKLLNDQQRAMHDEDVKLMYESFQTTDEQLNRIVLGEMSVDEFRNPPRPGRRRRAPTPSDPSTHQPINEVTPPAPVAPPQESFVDPNNPPTTVQPPEDAGAQDWPANSGGDQAQQENAVASGQQPVRGRAGRGEKAVGENFASEWERYVNEFITRYKLDDAQKQAAQKILKDVQEQAHRFVSGKRSQLEMLDKQLASAAKTPAAAQKVQAEKQEVLAPIQRMFEKQLKPRLERIPTRAQRQAAEAKPAPGAKVQPAKPGRK